MCWAGLQMAFSCAPMLTYESTPKLGAVGAERQLTGAFARPMASVLAKHHFRRSPTHFDPDFAFAS
jgi:hypothetical protein